MQNHLSLLPYSESIIKKKWNFGTLMYQILISEYQNKYQSLLKLKTFFYFAFNTIYVIFGFIFFKITIT